MSASDIDAILNLMYLNPLIGQGIVNYTNRTHRKAALEGDFLLDMYICKLDEEIFSSPPAGIDPKLWAENNYGAIFTTALDVGRNTGYAVLCFFDDVKCPYRIFTETDRTGWVRDDNKVIIGIKVNFDYRDAKKGVRKQYLFGKDQCYLFKFKEGDFVDVFARADISLAMWINVTMIRQIENQLDLMASRPEFMIAKYGQPTPTQRAAIKAFLDDASVMKMLGASVKALEGVDVIKHESFDNLLKTLTPKYERFAGQSRLPLAYYAGQRTSGSGTGGPAEMSVELKIFQRKKNLFNIIAPFIIEVLNDRHPEISLTEITISQDQDIEKKIENAAKETTEEPSSSDSGGAKGTPKDDESGYKKRGFRRRKA